MNYHNRLSGVRLWLTASFLALTGFWSVAAIADDSAADNGAVADKNAAADNNASTGGFSDYLSEVGEGVYLAGSLDLQALRNESAGPITVIDLRTEAEGTESEAAAARALGLGYANIPVSSATVDPAQVDALRAALSAADPQALVVVHCASGNRAGMLWGAAQLADGVPLDQVKSDVSSIMTKQPVIDGLDAYAKTLDAGL